MEQVENLEAQLAAVKVVVTGLIATHPQKSKLVSIFEGGLEQITSMLLSSQRSDEFLARVREEAAGYIELAKSLSTK